MTDKEKTARLLDMADHAFSYNLSKWDEQVLRECAELMREKTDAEWVASYERRYKGRLLSVVETRNGNWFWYADAFDPFDAQLANGREAAKAAAVAWVDGNETRNRDMEEKNGKS